MSRRALPFTVLSAAMIALLAACAAPTASEEEPSSSSEDELRSFKAGELVGTIAYGETKTVDHPATTTYRAYAFDAAKGDKIEATISAAGQDAVVWLLSSTNASIVKIDANHNTTAEVVTREITKAGRYYLAFREADYEPARFTVKLARLGAPPPPPPPPPRDTCTGTPRFPITGNIAAKTGTQVQYKRTCDAFGVCTAWAESARVAVPATSFTVSPGRYLRAEVALSTYTSQQGSSRYVCSTKDDGGVTLDETGKATSRMQWSDRCNIQGGSGGPYDIGEYRPSDFTFGARCASIVEQDPPAASNFGTQTKIAYYATFD